MKNVHDSVIDLIGNTPIVRLKKMGRETGATFYAKLEYLNPGASIKDRIAVQMIADAESSGALKPGGTIVECTSGNTGMGLAMVGAARGYKAVLVMPDKVSEEKIKALRAFGARVVTTPTAVQPEDPRSYYSVARRISEETPGAFFANQYHNMSNPLAHERTTGPEIWEQMGPELDAIVIASGTGGTLSGIAKVVKAKKPSIKMVCVDPLGSIYFDLWRTGKMITTTKSYKVEGFGEDFMPSTMDWKCVDEVIQVDDRECFVATRELTRTEGLFTGGSGGGAVAGAIKYAKAHPEAKTILIILPDSGSRYLSKVFDDDWMRENSFLDEGARHGTVADLIARRGQPLVAARPGDSVTAVIGQMKSKGISQIPVLDGGKLLGMIAEVTLLKGMLRDPATTDRAVGDMVSHNYTVVAPDTPVGKLATIFTAGHVALVQDAGKITAVLTNIDLIDYLAGALN
ncbi:MAG: pyridoxal-phosphate dependent enzyme [Acidobacteria bacterium]|nr:pyridoxal-phosphate dependent enzyme [Acidobacteriota bacterium]